MSHRSLRRHLTAGVLAAALLGAAPAHARDFGTAGSVWGWMQQVWGRGVAVLWERVPVTAERAGENQRKQGWGLDPNGAAAPQPSSEPCGTCDEARQGIDPNG